MKFIIDGYLRAIDSVNDWVGKLVSYLGLFMMVIVVIEVVSRYFLNSPTIWATEMNEMLLCGYAALAGGYALLHKSHVSVEIIQERLSRKTQAVLNLFTYMIGFVFLGILIWTSWGNAMEAWEYSERSESLFAPPLFPVKVTIPIGGVLFFLQLIAWYIREIRVLMGKGETNSDQEMLRGEGAWK
jgi:TRAP-type mannitol/chloroaromatic compound transport system permease small subunit